MNYSKDDLISMYNFIKVRFEEIKKVDYVSNRLIEYMRKSYIHDEVKKSFERQYNVFCSEKCFLLDAQLNIQRDLEKYGVDMNKYPLLN